MWSFKGGEDAELGVLHHSCGVFSEVIELSMWVGGEVLGVLYELLNGLVGSVGGGVVCVDSLEIEAEGRLEDSPQANYVALDQLHPL
jgi:hypothetical protein